MVDKIRWTEWDSLKKLTQKCPKKLGGRNVTCQSAKINVGHIRMNDQFVHLFRIKLATLRVDEQFVNFRIQISPGNKLFWVAKIQGLNVWVELSLVLTAGRLSVRKTIGLNLPVKSTFCLSSFDLFNSLVNSRRILGPRKYCKVR